MTVPVVIASQRDFEIINKYGQIVGVQLWLYATYNCNRIKNVKREITG